MRGRRAKQTLAVGGCLVAILGVAWYCASSRAESTRWNVILVTLDTTRADRVGCYGCSSARTPTLDALARAGALFEFARTPYPLTLPAHASLLSGLNPSEHGLQVNGSGRLSNDIPVLAELLQAANYDTGAFIAAYVLNSKFGLSRGFDMYDDDLAASAPQRPTADRRRDGQVVLDLALDWLEQRKSRPFFCWIHLYDPHGPYIPRTEIFGDAFADRPYDGGIAYADRQVGRLQEFLEKRKLTRRTLLIVVGDHGEGLLEHNEPDHGYQLYDATLRVPLIFAGPSWIQSGARVPTPVSLIDVMPTILDCLSIPVPGPVAGSSFKAALAGGQIPAKACYSETELGFLESRCSPLRSVATERWKYIETSRPELYDLALDPQEVRNLAENEPTQAAELAELLEQLREKMRPASADSMNLTPDDRRILASLGYVGGRSSKPPAPAEQLPDVKDMLPHYVRLSEARARADDGEVVAAIEMVREILDQAPRYSTARLFLGDLLVRERLFDAAAGEYAAVASDQPDNAEAHAFLANALAAQGLFQDSVPHYRKAIDIDPTGAPYHYYFAFTLIRLGNSAEAILQLEEAVRWNPAFVEARLQLGKLLAENGRTDGAVQQYEAALKYRPGLPRPPWLRKPGVSHQP
jgi:arylsulfatase A-like enzyme/Flp pilus assembly protein TadD